MLTVERTSETHLLAEEIIPACMKEIIAKETTKEIAESRELAPGHTVRVRLSRERTWGKIAVLESEVASGVGEAPHVEAREDRTMHIVRGTFWVRIGGEIHTAGPGDTLSIPHGVVHAWRQVGYKGGAFVTVVTPIESDGVAELDEATRSRFAVALARRYAIEYA
jgi:quercetin dioxygenase-like cupin family protein